MENTFEPQSKLLVTEDVRSYIYETTKWTRFLSIIGFIFAGLVVISGFSIGSLMMSSQLLSERLSAAGGINATVATVIMLLYALLLFYPSLLLFKYSNAAAKAMLYNDQEALSQSASKLKSFFKFYGIMSVVSIAIFVIMFIFTLVAGLTM